MQRSKRPLFAVLVVVVLLAVTALAVMFWPDKDKSPAASNSAVADVKAEDDVTGVVGRYLFSGTVVIARAVENEARTSSGIDYDQPFSKFSTFNPSQYDAWEFDHECPMTMQNIPYRQQVTNTMFNCRPEFIPAMKKVFPNIITNIANNHTHDLGDDGWESTVKLLEEGGIQTFGNYDPREKQDICQVVSLPVRVQKKDKTEVKGTLPVAFCAWHYFEKDPVKAELEVAKRYAKVMPVFAFSQVGVEYRDEADTKQISVAHSLIDTGAPEFVIENSPHWIQNTEVYKDKLIVYSTGNFIFDQLDEETNRGLSIDTSMNIDYDDNVAKWLSLGDKCKGRDDACLDEAENLGLTKVKLNLKFEAVGSTTGYKELTQKANAAEQAAIEERANWATTKEELGQ
jgi:poly-gamma-glutamate synthesis protein (capsule biosynthesis protein)